MDFAIDARFHLKRQFGMRDHRPIGAGREAGVHGGLPIGDEILGALQRTRFADRAFELGVEMFRHRARFGAVRAHARGQRAVNVVVAQAPGVVDHGAFFRDAPQFGKGKACADDRAQRGAAHLPDGEAPPLAAMVGGGAARRRTDQFGQDRGHGGRGQRQRSRRARGVLPHDRAAFATSLPQSSLPGRLPVMKPLQSE
ncbi:hypothetical protein CH337_09665 [Rhodoblastus acidophilus]|nr:hypothetical protein CH337_09665 [Rhodoblastus acidophilus]